MLFRSIAFAYYTQSLKVDYSSEKPVLLTEAYDLVWQFQMNEGNELLNKVVQVKGQVTGYDSLLIILNHKIVCQPHNTKIEKPKIGETVTMKGRCVSYDDLLEELRLDHVVQIIDKTI